MFSNLFNNNNKIFEPLGETKNGLQKLGSKNWNRISKNYATLYSASRKNRKHPQPQNFSA